MDGQVIGNYRVLKKLGEGGMGAVYVAEHSLIGRKAAIKVLLPTLSQHQDIVQRFFNEARAATAINDPGIVQIFDFGYHTDGSAFIVMEYLEGETLDARLRRFGRLPPHDAVRIMRQVASSLASAHARGIIHRDLKPENIFLVKDAEVAGGERAKVLDFGIAKLTGDGGSKAKTSTGAIMGTPYFMSPEQCRGAGQVDHRSDVYALGCVLYQLVTGTPPFDGEGAGEIIAAHLMTPPSPPSSRVPGIPPELDALIMRCLQKHPDQRYGSMEEMVQVLGQLSVHLTSPGMPTVMAPSGPYMAQATPPPYGSYGTQPGQVAYGTQPGQPASPTTLSAVASQIQIAPTAAPRKRGLGLAIAAIGIAAAGAVAAVVITTGGGSDSTTSSTSPKEPEIPEPTKPEPEIQPPTPEPEIPEPPRPEPEVTPPVEPPKPEVPETPEIKDDPAPDKKAATDGKDAPKKKKPRKKRPRERPTPTGVPGDFDGDGIPDER